MGAIEEATEARIIREMGQTLRRVRGVKLPPARWTAIGTILNRMVTAIEGGKLAEVDRLRKQLDRKIPPRQATSAEPTVVEQPVPMPTSIRTTSERLSGPAPLRPRSAWNVDEQGR